MYHVIDIGSNSIRLLKTEGGRVLQKSLETTRLGKNIERTKRLSADSYLESVSVIKRFCDEAKTDKTEGLFAFATQAVREARNGKLFCDELYGRFNLKVDVLSGEEEAKLGFLGACTGKGGELVFDIGGASFEMSFGIDGKPLYCCSVPVGIVKIFDNSKRSEEDIRRYLSQFDAQIDVARNAIFRLADDNNIAKSEVLATFIGGTSAATCACLLDLEEYDDDKVDDARFSTGELRGFIEIAENSTPDRLFESYCISRRRAETILGGDVLMALLMEKFSVSVGRSSKSDNLEGYAKQKGLL